MINKLFACILCLFLSISAQAQSDAVYTSDIQKAANLYFEKNYLQSAQAYMHAFANYGGHGYTDDRYTAACSWALAGTNDSAFAQLMHITTKGGFQNLDRLLIDDDLDGLHNDARWQQLLTLVKQNKEKNEGPANKKQKTKSAPAMKKTTAPKSATKK